MGALLSSRYLHAETTPDYLKSKSVFVVNTGGCPGDLWLPSSAEKMNTISQAYTGETAGVANFRSVQLPIDGHASSRQALGEVTSDWSLQGSTIDVRIAGAIGHTARFPLMYIGAMSHLALQYGNHPLSLIHI